MSDHPTSPSVPSAKQASFEALRARLALSPGARKLALSLKQHDDVVQHSYGNPALEFATVRFMTPHCPVVDIRIFPDGHFMAVHDEGLRSPNFTDRFFAICEAFQRAQTFVNEWGLRPQNR